jgi:hypothetical protein
MMATCSAYTLDTFANNVRAAGGTMTAFGATISLFGGGAFGGPLSAIGGGFMAVGSAMGVAIHAMMKIL